MLSSDILGSCPCIISTLRKDAKEFLLVKKAPALNTLTSLSG